MSVTSQDIDFTPNESEIDEIQAHYSRILDSAGLNTADQISSNIGYFNSTGKIFADPPRAGKTVIFMTRPNLNLRSNHNIAASRTLNYFASSRFGRSIMRNLIYGPTARNMVYGYYPTNGMKDLSTYALRVPIVGKSDDLCIGGAGGNFTNRDDINTIYPMAQTNFIPLISNCCQSISNAKDITMDVWETDGDFAGNKLAYAAGIDENFSIGELTLNFEDIWGSPVFTMFTIWLYYMHYVGKGICFPEYKYIINRIIDYTSSIYVFMLGTDQQTILRWTKYSGVFPRSVPFGQIVHSKEIDNNALSQVSIPCQYNFCCPMDPIVLSEFNMLSGPSLYNRFIRLGKPGYASKMVNHQMKMSDAYDILVNAQPTYTPNDILNSDIPMKAIEMPDTKVDLTTDWDKTDIAQNSYRRVSLINREQSHMRNVYGSIPYIVDGNKLMWL